MSQFQSTVTIAVEYGLLGLTSKYNTISILPNTATLIDLSVVERTSLFLQADSDNAVDIFVGLDDTVTTNKAFCSLTGGEKIQFILSKTSAPIIYVYSTVATKILVLEGSEK